MVQENQIIALFRTHFPDVLALLGESSLLQQFLANPTYPLPTVQLSQHHLADKVLLLGDAAHATLPYIGQGMNSGMEVLNS